MNAPQAPRSVALSAGVLTLAWEDGESALAAAVLRAGCRCAACRSALLAGAPAAVDAGVTLVDARPVGHYAIQLVFSDDHDRGIYPWALLRALDSQEARALEG